MTLPKVLKNFNLIIDGVGFLGKVSKVTLPKIAIKTEELRAAGMDAPIEIDMGVEKLELGFELPEFDPKILALIGLHANTAGLILKGAFQKELSLAVPVVIVAHGAIKGFDPGDWEVGKINSNKFDLAIRRYSLTVEGAPVINIDIENGIRQIGGVDQLAGIRNIIGG